MAYVDSLAAVTFNSNEVGWFGYTIRVLIPASELLVSGGPTRITLEASAGGSCNFGACYVGHGASSGDVYDFESTPVQLTVGGSGNFTILAGATAVSDDIAFTLDETKPLLVAGYFPTNPTVLRYVAYTGMASYYKNASDASTQNATGYTTGTANRLYFVKRVEVDVVVAGQPMAKRNGGVAFAAPQSGNFGRGTGVW